MTEQSIPSRALEVWRRLYTRFNLEPGPAGVGPDVSKTIIPTTDVGELLKVPDVLETTSGGLSPGESFPVTVPEGERWHLRAYEFGRTSQDRNIDGVLLRDPAGQVINIDTFTGASFRIGGLNANVPVLDQGWSIGLSVSGGSADSTFLVTLLIDVERAF